MCFEALLPPHPLRFAELSAMALSGELSIGNVIDFRSLFVRVLREECVGIAFNLFMPSSLLPFLKKHFRAVLPGFG